MVLLTIAGRPACSGATARPAPITARLRSSASPELTPPPAAETAARCGAGGAANARAWALVAAACWKRRRASAEMASEMRLATLRGRFVRSRA